MKLVDIATYLVYMATYIVVVPILVAIFLFTYQPKELKILLAGLIITLFFDVVLLFFNAKTIFLYIFTLIDVITAVWMFSVVIRNMRIRKQTQLAGGLFTLFTFVDAFVLSGTNHNGYANFIGKLFVIILTIYYLTQLFQDETVDKLSEQPLFWVCVGSLANNLIGLFDVFSEPILSYSRTLYLQFYLIWSVAAIFMYGCCAIAFWVAKRPYPVKAA